MKTLFGIHKVNIDNKHLVHLYEDKTCNKNIQGEDKGVHCNPNK